MLIVNKVNAQYTDSNKINIGIKNLQSTHINCAHFLHQQKIKKQILQKVPQQMLPLAQYTNPIAIQNCGKFRLYYEDVQLSTGFGFDASAQGSIRRNTLCLALTYIQSIIDFSQIPSNDPIKIEVEQSLNNSALPMLANAGAYANVNQVNGLQGYYGGLIYDKTTNYINYATLLGTQTYDGRAQFNFGHDFHDDGNLLMPDCPLRYDLFSIAIHEFLHSMGWFSNLKEDATFLPKNLYNNNCWSKMDEHFLYHGDINIGNYQKFIIGGSTPVINPLLNTVNIMRDNQTWMRNIGINHDNAPVYSGTYNAVIPTISGSFFTHLDDQLFSENYRHNLSPKKRAYYVMGASISQALNKRVISEEEIRSLLIIGYSLNPSFNNTNTITNNHKPESSHFYSDPINISFPPPTLFSGIPLSTINFLENGVAPDFTIINNNTTSISNTTQLAININTLSYLSDLDGDIISVLPNSVVGIRGVSKVNNNSNNNHDCITLNTSNQILYYTPRPDFIGRAQFMCQITDGKEDGAIVLFTIDVNAGLNFSTLLTNSEMIINGDFENGTEYNDNSNGLNGTKRSNNIIQQSYKIGEIGFGSRFIDGQSFSNLTWAWYPSIMASGSSINHNSATNCGNVSNVFKGFLPATWPPQAAWTHPSTVVNTLNPNNRYLLFNTYFDCFNFKMNRSFVQNQWYTISFDIYGNTPINNIINLRAIPLVAPLTAQPALHTENLNLIGLSPSQWHHISHTFQYCNAIGTDIISFQNSIADSYLDNLSVLETSAPPLAILASANPLTINCGSSSNLMVGLSYNSCSLQFNWAPANTLNNANIQNPIATPNVTTMYTITVTDPIAGITATDVVLITVNPMVITASLGNNCSLMVISPYNITTNYFVNGTAVPFATPITNYVPGTIYTVTAVAAAGCSATTTFMYSLPSVTISSNPNLPCYDDINLITLTANGVPSSVSYQWSNNVISSFANTATVANGTFFVTVTDANGCTNSTSIIVGVLGIPLSFNVIKGCVGGIPLPASIIMTSGFGFTVLPSLGVTISGNNITFTIPNTTYTITNAGCPSPATIFIGNCSDCPNAPATATWFNSPTFGTSVNTGVTYVFSGTTAVNGALSFNNSSTVFNTANASINLNTNTSALFVLNNSVLRGCQSLWNGVKASQQGQLVSINKSTIRDAKVGCDISNNASISSTNQAQFLDCRDACIRLFNTNATATNTIITNTSFKSTASLLPPGAICSNPNGFCDIGIDVDNVQNALTIGTTSATATTHNVFQNLNNGIYVHNINMTTGVPVNYSFINNEFTNMHDDCSPQVPPFNITNPFNQINTGLFTNRKGTGVYFDNTVVGISTTISGNGGYVGMFDCEKGVVSRGKLHLTVTNQNILNTIVGVAVNDLNKFQYSINGNMMAKTQLGVIMSIGATTPVSVLGNTITTTNIGVPNSTTGFTNFLLAPRAIHIIKTVSTITSGVTIARNTVTIPAICGQGIRLDNGNSGDGIISNTINYLPNNFTQSRNDYIFPGGNGFGNNDSRWFKGIVTRFCDRVRISENQVVGIDNFGALSLPSPSNVATAIAIKRLAMAYRFEGNKNMFINCNTAKFMSIGFSAWSNCANTALNNMDLAISNNKFNATHLPWHFERTGGATPTFGEVGRLAVGGSLNLDNNNRFQVNNSGTISWITGNRRVWRNQGGFFSSFPNNIVTINNNSEGVTVFQSQSPPLVNFNRYRIPNLSGTTTLATDNCSNPIFNIVGNGTTDPDALAMALNDYEATIDANSATSDNPDFPIVNDWLEKQNIYTLLQENPSLQNASLDLDQFYNAMASGNLGSLHASEEVLVALEDRELSNADFMALLATLQNHLDDIITTEDHIASEKTMDALLLKTITTGIETFTTIEKAFVHTLANICVYVGGRGVLKARWLNAYFNPAEDPEDMVLCAVASMSGNRNAQKPNLDSMFNGQYNMPDTEELPAQSNTTLVTIYPNPSDAAISFITDNKSAVNLKIYNQLGEEVMHTKTINLNGSKLDIKHLPQGFYTISCRFSDGNIFNGKLIKK